MGPSLEALLKVQSVELQLAHVRGRLRMRENAVKTQERRIGQLREQWQEIHDRALARRADADRIELDLKAKEEAVSKLRSSLNTAKTNKEYAAILTQINSTKADNAKLEEEALKIMQEVDAVKAEGTELESSVAEEEQRLAEVRKNSEEEITRLRGMLEDLTAQREEAAAGVPPEKLAAFDRIAEQYDGEGMAVIEVHGNKPPYNYICGGCFMQLTAEHANALRVRDEIRTCDNCGRILYMDAEGEATG